MGATSWQVKQRYNQKTYKRVQADIQKELVEAWEEQIESDKISKAEFIRNAIENYLSEKK